MPAEFLSPVEVKFLAGDGTGVFEGYAATFSADPDRKGDTIARGAFHRSLLGFLAAEAWPPLLWQHDQAEPVGAITELQEDGRGLRIAGRIITETVHGPEAYALAKAGALSLSIGFVTRQSERAATGRLLTDIDLVEVSLVSVPANPRARILSVKSADGDADHEEKNMDEVETKTVEEIGAKVDALAGGFASLSDRIDRVELKANRPGAAAVENKTTAEIKSFTAFIRRGVEKLDAVEVKDLIVSNDTAGGYLAPEQFVAELLRNVVLFSPVRSVARVTPIGSSAAILPKRTGRLTASWVGETQARPETQPTFGQNRYEVKELACYVDVSTAMLEDAALDIGSELAFDFAEEFGRAEGAAFVNGTGILAPFGFMADANIASTPSGAAAAVTADGLIQLYHDLPAPYRMNAVWGMNSGTLAAVRKLKDPGTGAYLLLTAGIANAPATTLLGRPVIELPDMPDVAGGAFPVVFGDFSQGYRIFDRVQLAVLRDPYSQATSGLVRFHARRRVAAGVGKAEALRKLRIATS